MPGPSRLPSLAAGYARLKELLQPYARFRPLLGLVIVAVVGVFFWARAERVAADLRANPALIDWRAAGLAWLLTAAGFLWQAVAWGWVMRTLGADLRIGQGLQIFFLSTLPRYLPGSMWGYLGRVYLGEQVGVRPRLTVLGSLAEIVLFVGTGLGLSLFQWLEWPLAGALAILLLLLSVAILAGMTTGPNVRTWLAWAGLYVAYLGFWILYGMSYVVLLLPRLSSLSVGTVGQVIAGGAFAWLVGFLTIFVPSGVGVREALLVLTFEPLAGNAYAVYVAVMARLLNLVADGIFFFLFYVFVSVRSGPFSNYIKRITPKS